MSYEGVTFCEWNKSAKREQEASIGGTAKKRIKALKKNVYLQRFNFNTINKNLKQIVLTTN